MFKTMDNESGAYYQLNTKTDTYNHKNYLYKPSRNSVWEDQYLVENGKHGSTMRDHFQQDLAVYEPN